MYDQEMSQSQATYQPMASKGREHTHMHAHTESNNKNE